MKISIRTLKNCDIKKGIAVFYLEELSKNREIILDFIVFFVIM